MSRPQAKSGAAQPAADRDQNLVYIETGKNRCFACSLDWPGLCRSGKGEEAALSSLSEYVARYAVVAAKANVEFPLTEGQPWSVVQRVPTRSGGADFGVPTTVLDDDGADWPPSEAKRAAALLAASWERLDEVAAGAPEALRKGPGGAAATETPSHSTSPGLSSYSGEKLASSFRSPMKVTVRWWRPTGTQFWIGAVLVAPPRPAGSAGRRATPRGASFGMCSTMPGRSRTACRVARPVDLPDVRQASSFSSMDLDGLDPKRMPRHVACVMDGNGRWATKQGLPRTEGHRAGEEACWMPQGRGGTRARVVHRLRLFDGELAPAARPRSASCSSVIADDLLTRRRDELHAMGVRIRFAGPAGLAGAEMGRPAHGRGDGADQPQHGDHADCGVQLRRAGRDRGRRPQPRSRRGETSDINERALRRHLYVPGMPDPDLFIRTSGEYRISNFLLWEIAYSELVFMDVLWPDFRREHLRDAVREYQQRERRFGRPGRSETRTACPPDR